MRFPPRTSGTYAIILLFVQCAISAQDGPKSFTNNKSYAKRHKNVGKMYFAIATSPSEQQYSRAFNKTLMNITQTYLTRERYNVTIDTLIVDLPENGSFTALVLERLCEQFEGKHVIAVLLIGDSPAAFTVSLAATHSGVPVLWARDKGGFLPGFRSLESRSLEIHLAPTGRELVQALRGVLLQAHWHTFTVLADSGSASGLQRPEIWNALSAYPLHPSLITLPTPLKATFVFRKLADISRSTRGVVVVFGDRQNLVKILVDAKRLNMLDGHFVWIWIDTSETSSYKDFTDDLVKELKDNDKEATTATSSTITDNAREDRVKREFKSDISDFRINYLLRNDQFLLFTNNNNKYGVESSKSAKRNDNVYANKNDINNNNNLNNNNYYVSNTNNIVIKSNKQEKVPDLLPVGLLSLRPLPIRVDRHLVKGAVRLLVTTLKLVLARCPEWLYDSIVTENLTTSCWKPPGVKELNFSTVFGRELVSACSDALAGNKSTQEIGVDKVDKSLVANFEILNLVPEHATKEDDVQNKTDHATQDTIKWKRVGMVSGRSVRLDTIVWPGGDLSVSAISARARTVFRVVTALAPPFVMESELDEDGQCLRGLPCHRVLTSDKDNLTLVFNEMEYKLRLEEDVEELNNQNGDPEYNNKQHNQDYIDDEKFFPFHKFKYKTNCCYGLSMDLLENVAQELEFDFRLYIVADGLFGTKMVTKEAKTKRDVGKKFVSYRVSKDDLDKRDDFKSRSAESDTDVKWNGIVGDLVSGAAHMSFAPLSVSSSRSEVIDYSVPYFYGGVSFLAAPQQKSEIPLMAFLLPFSPELWIAIFTSLNITAIAVAIYEWLSPFGLNPWGRQRSKNFSMSSALWVMWGLLCGHLVAFKAPKSWPNKFLINVWGGFSVIFVASYTANIAALIAGLFFQNTVSDYHDRSLLSQKVGTPRASASEFYVQKANRLLWDHMKRFALEDVEDGIARLRNGSLDILIADTPILDYYRATDHGCKLQKIGDTINEDTYAIGMTKGFPLKDSISAVIAKYSSNGYIDILQEKWYGGLPCFKLATEIAQPRPLGVAAVTGVFILLGMGIVLGCLILFVEHMFFRYYLPLLRDKPKGSVWRSRNIMFFSQKLYRFINCVELVSPHHAARELVHTIRQGQITSLFQKSIKRKEHEQRRRRKSKAQFFEMIQEIRSTIRRQQQEEREMPLESVTEVDSEYQLSPDDKKPKQSPSLIKRTFLKSSPKMDNNKTKSSLYFNKQLFSPRSKNKAKSSSNLNVRRFSTDSVFNSQTLKVDRSTAVGRRLSKDATAFLSSSPPDINSRRSSYLDIINSGSKLSGKSPVLSIENVSDCSGSSDPRKLSDSESIGKKLATLPKYKDPFEKTKLHPQYSLQVLGKSEEMLNRSDKESTVATAKSFQNLSSDTGSKSNLSDDEIARRNKLTIQQLQTQITQKGQNTKTSSSSKRASSTNNNNANKSTTNPQIRIKVEDTSLKPNPTSRKLKTRHQSLGEPSNSKNQQEVSSRRGKLTEHSRSLDSNTTRDKIDGRLASSGGGGGRSPRCREHNLPPAPPPPNCSPRNSDGRSPLERLSKDELVLLWRSSESELRSHLLKAIRDKNTDEPP